MSEKRRKRRQWGNGSIDRAANGTWKIRWCEPGKRKTRGGLRSRDDAERVLAKVLGDMAQGRSGLPADPAIIPKLSELAPDYFERRKRTHRAGFEDASRWRKHVAPYFEHLRPAQVDAARMRAFIEAKLAQKANPATVPIDARPAHDALHREADRRAPHLPRAARAAQRRLRHRRSRRPANGRGLRAALLAEVTFLVHLATKWPRLNRLLP